jgi:hypothetical protein
MEERDWKLSRNALHKSDRKKFDEMWDIPKWYISACSNSLQYVRLHPILMSILLYDYKQLTECISEVGRIETKVNSSSKKKEKPREMKWNIRVTRHTCKSCGSGRIDFINGISNGHTCFKSKTWPKIYGQLEYEGPDE